MNDTNSIYIFLWFIAFMAVLWVVRELQDKKGRK